MTTLDQTATASDLPSAGTSSPGLPPDAEGDPTVSAPAVVLCSITAADSGAAGATRDDSVPRPRDGGSGEGAGGGAEAGQTAALIRAGLAARLRTAYGEGRSLVELAAARRRPVTEIHTLLAEGAGAEASRRSGSGGVIRLQPPAASAGGRSVPVLRAVQQELRTARSKRPSPSRRLRRMHPEVTAGEPTGDQVWTAAASIPSPAAVGEPSVVAVTPEDSAPGEAVLRDAASGGGSLRDAASAGGAVGVAADAGAETPLGILIGGTPNLPEAVGRPEEREPVRVTAELVRIGRGTVLVVLPAWRPAIAVSVPTDHLLHATGIGYDRLGDIALSVLINPGALHDRELDLHGWQAGQARSAGRRGGRSALRA
ncbi:hypothetical protein [Kitasatospora sp. NPDC047058]|uniref:hypothetical protein n=1 Tax=Kitasatospora sp. NPDC047058 TaxID=3155620 RepID=UPI0033FFEFA5